MANLEGKGGFGDRPEDINKKGSPYAYNTFKALYRKYGIQTMQQLDEIDLSVIPVKEVAVIKVIKKMITEEDFQAMKLWENREEGMPKQSIESDVTSNVKEDIHIKIID